MNSYFVCVGVGVVRMRVLKKLEKALLFSICITDMYLLWDSCVCMQLS